MKCKLGLIVLVLILIATSAECRRRVKKTPPKENKQLFIETKETSPPNFVRLLLMRLAYGLASQMGLEERLSGMFNGAFVPPNADNDYLDLGFDDSDLGLFDE